ncbi:MAG: hypothetical protein VX965_07030, partial [Candidatus Thermoplasmatota archaeon]|nr:hypothetical protein [Candidatus Thermoplasmatota archaeon]
MEETLGDIIAKLFEGGYRTGTVQEIRRDAMFKQMMGVARAAERAANLVMSIIEENEDRMQMDDANHLLITGTLAIYRVDIGSFMAK